MFKIGDRVRLSKPIASSDGEPAGTVAGFITPEFAAHLSTPDDVLVRWDSGLEIAHAPFTLMLAARHPG